MRMRRCRRSMPPAVSIALFLVALATRRGFVATVAVVLIQLASAQTVSVMKHAFDRARPTSHIVLEAMPSYPSGHAAGAVAFYGGVAWLVWQSRLTAFWKRCATGMLIVLMIGIGWSRIALGAHYVTDVLGGYLVGAAWLLAGTAIFSAQVSKGRSR
jgi:undecaprenyl-diphosphatase